MGERTVTAPRGGGAASEHDLIAAVDIALHAASVHDTQPWRRRVAPEVVDLFADDERHLVATDPGRRDLVLSCGAALHHLAVAVEHTGFACTIERRPDAERSDHLAHVLVHQGPGDSTEALLLPAIGARRTDRRR